MGVKEATVKDLVNLLRQSTQNGVITYGDGGVFGKAIDEIISIRSPTTTILWPICYMKPTKASF